MQRGWTRSLLALAVPATVGILLGVVPAACAHTQSTPWVDAAASSAVVAGAPAPAAATIWLALVLTFAGGLVVMSPRRMVVVALAVLLIVLAVETSVHSVHHLTDRQASQCAVASTSSHIPGAAPPFAPDVSCVATLVRMALELDVDRSGSRPLRPDEGRAPPAA